MRVHRSSDLLMLLVALLLPAVVVSQKAAQAQEAVPAAPRKIRDAHPVYPLDMLKVVAAMKVGFQGSVTLDVTIGVDGKVTDIVVLRGNALFDRPAMAAVSKWVYDVRGVKTPMKTLVTVPFAAIKSSEVAKLRAAEDKDVWVVGKIVRVEPVGAFTNLYLEAPRDVYVATGATEINGLRRTLQAAFDWGPHRLIGRTIAFSAKPLAFNDVIRLNLTFTVDAITLLD